MSALERPGILLTAFGGPDSIEAVEPFMKGLMGRVPSPEIVARAQDKYRAIGGKSPLTDIALSISAALEQRLSREHGHVPVRVGMRYWHPYIADAVHELLEAGARRVVMTSLSPFESKVACGAYRAAAHEAAEDLEISGVCETPSLHLAPEFREFLGHALVHALEGVPGEQPLVVMTAHSLPVSDLSDDDPYVAGLREVADAVAAFAGLAEARDVSDPEPLPDVFSFGALEGPVPWVFAYQSKGARPGDWLGPDLDTVFEVAAKTGYDSVVVCPVGFATDHMETLYDLDIVAEEWARKLGLGFTRTRVPNDDPLLIEAFAMLLAPYIGT